MAIKTCVAVVIAYAIALHMDWEKPYWAAWTAFSIGLATRGEGIHKGLMRLAGGLVGAVAGLMLLAFFIQDRWLFIAFLSLYAAVFSYLGLESSGKGYFWQQAGFFAAVVAFDSAFHPTNAFEVGVERAQETGAGLVTYVVVGLLLWPENSRRDLEQSASRLVSNVQQFFGQYISLLSGRHDLREGQGQEDQIHTLQAGMGRLLDAAERDSWAVAETRSAWRAFQAQIGELIETLIRSKADLDELQVRNLSGLAPGLPIYLEEIKRRLAEIEQMLEGKAPASRPAAILLEWDDRQLRLMPHFDRAAVTVQRDRLEQVDSVTRALFDAVCGIRDFQYGAEEASARGPGSPARLPVAPFSLDRDHLDEALRVALSTWLMFLAVVYIPGVPAGLGALGIATRIALADSAMPSVSVTALVVPVIIAMAGAFPFYIFLLPQLSTFPQLAVALSFVVFAIVYVFHEPRQALMRTLLAYLFFSMIGVTNEQSYSFVHYATSLLMWLVILSVLTVTEYVPVSHQSDRAFFRLLRRYLRSCEFLLQLARTPREQYSLTQRFKADFHEYEVRTLPAKLAQWGRSLTPAARGKSTPEQVRAYIQALDELSFRIQALLEARIAHQSATLVHELRPDIGAWRTGVEGILQTLALDPMSADYQDLRSRLLSTLSRLELRIKEVLDKTDEKIVAAEEFGNMYRLLGAHRGVSESLVRLTRNAAAIDWERLRESRF
jgi:uncharacterized membrane protein YccC